MAVRRPVLAGNWKMHKDPEEARAFISAFAEQYAARDDRSVILFPPALSLAAAREAASSRGDLKFGVQNIHFEARGAYTGEISAGMAAAAGADYVLVGHSERRHLFGETVSGTIKKVEAALGAGLSPVLCVGETLEDRRDGRAESVVREQLDPVLEAVADDAADRLLVAYEPVWAIGTGETASPSDAEAMHRFVRSRLVARFREGAAARIPILYGGSVKPENVEELLARPEVDGALVGGASLEPESFYRICSVAS